MVYKHRHPEWFESLKKPDIRAYGGSIIIHGTEGMGALAAHALKTQGFEFICFMDNDVKKQGGEYLGHRVLSPAQVYKQYPNALVFIASTSINAIQTQLTEIGFKEVYDCYTLLKEIDLDGLEYKWSNAQICRNIDTHFKFVLRAYEMIPDSVVQTMNVGVTTKCTLRCKNCSQYIPYIKDPKDYNSDVIVEIVKKITTDLEFDIIDLRISLAEAFLYQDLHKFLDKLSNLERVETISVLTNGTILPSQAVLDKLMADKRIIVRISNYGKVSRKMNELTRVFNESGVNYEITNHLFWVQQDEMTYQDLNHEELFDKFHNCFCRVPTLADGKLYYCFSEFLGETLGIINEGVTAIDFTSGINDEDAKNGIIVMLRRKQAIPACHYCQKVYREKLRRVPVAEQIDY